VSGAVAWVKVSGLHRTHRYGTLRDRLGVVVTFGDCLDVWASYGVEVGELPADFDPSWNKDRT